MMLGISHCSHSQHCRLDASMVQTFTSK